LRKSAGSLPAAAGYSGRKFTIRSTTSVTRLVELAPAGGIFVVQAVANVALAELISEMLLV